MISGRSADAERTAQARADEVLDALGGTVEGIKTALRHLGHGTGVLCACRRPPSRPQRIARLAGPVPVP